MTQRSVFNPYAKYIGISEMYLKALGFSKVDNFEDCEKCTNSKIFFVEFMPQGFKDLMEKATHVASIYSDGGIRFLKVEE